MRPFSRVFCAVLALAAMLAFATTASAGGYGSCGSGVLAFNSYAPVAVKTAVVPVAVPTVSYQPFTVISASPYTGYSYSGNLGYGFGGYGFGSAIAVKRFNTFNKVFVNGVRVKSVRRY